MSPVGDYCYVIGIRLSAVIVSCAALAAAIYFAGAHEARLAKVVVVAVTNSLVCVASVVSVAEWKLCLSSIYCEKESCSGEGECGKK